VDPELPLVGVRSGRDIVADSIVQLTFTMAALGVAAAMASCLPAPGAPCPGGWRCAGVVTLGSAYPALGPAFRTPSDTRSSKALKFAVNIPASFRAWAS
jgi:hypothetical protein